MDIKRNAQVQGRQTEPPGVGILLEQVIDALSAHVAVLDSDSTIIAVNNAWRAFAKVNHLNMPDDGMGANYLTVCHKVVGPEVPIAQAVSCAIKDVLRQQRSMFELEYPCPQPDRLLWFQIRITRFVLLDAVYLVVAHENITERKLAQLCLEESEKRFRLLIERSSDVLLLLEADGTVRYISPSIEALLGYTPQERAGRYTFELVHPDDLADIEQHYRQLFHTPHECLRHQFRMQHRDGSWKWIEANGKNYLDDRDIQGIIVSYRDITEHKLLEQRKDEFIAMASHELKTPLTSLKLFMGVLQRRFKKQGEVQYLEQLRKIDTQVNTLTELINDMLDVSRIQVGKLVMRVEQFNLSQLIRETAENMQGTLNTHEIRIEVEEDVEVSGDQERIGQVLINLLTNAIKYSPQANLLIVRLTKNQEDAIVSVQDFGIGIDKAHQQKIFERFYQVTGPLEKTFPGLGIGLYISNEIIKRHHGQMWVESEKGHGATFSFTIPLRKQEEL